MADVWDEIIEGVKKYGWFVIQIPREKESPPYAFSIGLYHTFNHPEIVVSGLDFKIMARMINNIGDLVKGGNTFSDGNQTTEILENYACAFRSVQPRWYYDFLGAANWYYNGENYPVLECIWPDKQHFYPWQDNFDQRLKNRQLDLYSYDKD